MNYTLENSLLIITNKQITQEEFEIVCRTNVFTELDCSDCVFLIYIPNIPGLVTLMCYNCPFLESLPIMPKLKCLWCDNCPLLESLPSMPELKILLCCNCQLLKSLPSMPELESLSCDDCPLLNNKIKDLADYKKIRNSQDTIVQLLCYQNATFIKEDINKLRHDLVKLTKEFLI